MTITVAPPKPPLLSHDFQNFKCTLQDNASTYVSAFLAKCFLRGRFFKISLKFSIIFKLYNGSLYDSYCMVYRTEFMTKKL